MPFVSQRPPLLLSLDTRAALERLGVLPRVPPERRRRALILLAYADGATVSAIARDLGMNRPMVERCIAKALAFGPVTALGDLPRRGRPPSLTRSARAWVVELSCRRPAELGYGEEFWTTERLARHVRTHGAEAGHPSLAELSRGTVTKILAAANIVPQACHRRLQRQPAVARPTRPVLYIRRDVSLTQDGGAIQAPQEHAMAIPQGLNEVVRGTADARHGAPGAHPHPQGDTLALVAALDLLTGQLVAIAADRDAALALVALLKDLDAAVPASMRVQLIPADPTASAAPDTRRYLATRANRFEFIFGPAKDAWLTLIDTLVGKLMMTLMQGNTEVAPGELRERLERGLDELNRLSLPLPRHSQYGDTLVDEVHCNTISESKTQSDYRVPVVST